MSIKALATMLGVSTAELTRPHTKAGRKAAYAKLDALLNPVNEYDYPFTKAGHVDAQRTVTA